MKRSMIWVVIAAMAAMLAMTGAALAQTTVGAGLEIQVISGYAIGWDPDSEDAKFTISIASAAGDEETYSPDLNDDGVQSFHLGRLLWSALLANGVDNAEIVVEMDNHNAEHGGEDFTDVIDLDFLYGDIECESATAGRSCGDLMDSNTDVKPLINTPGNYFPVVRNIGNSYTGTGLDSGLPISLILKITDWNAIRGGSFDGDLIFTIKNQ